MDLKYKQIWGRFFKTIRRFWGAYILLRILVYIIVPCQRVDREAMYFDMKLGP